MDTIYKRYWHCFRRLQSAGMLAFPFILIGIFATKGISQGSLKIKMEDPVQARSSTFQVDVWAYPGNSNLQSLSVYLQYDPEFVELIDAESDPENRLDLTLIDSHDQANGILAVEGGVFNAIQDSLHIFSLTFQAIKETSQSSFFFIFSESGPGTHMLNTSLTSLLTPASHPPLTYSIVCSTSILDAGEDQVLCGNETQLQGSTPTEGQGQWQVIEGSGGLFAQINDPNTSFSGVAGNSYQLVWSLQGNSCPTTKDTVSIQFEKTPTQAYAGEDQILCSPSTDLSANTPKTGEGKWEIISGNNGYLEEPLNPETTFQGTKGETYQLRWTVSNGTCPSSSDQVEIQFLGNAEYADAGLDQQICGSQAELEARSPGVSQGTWEVIEGIGGVIANRSTNQTQFTGIQGETYRLRWTLENSGCSSFDEVEINFVNNPSEADAGENIFHCGNQVQLNAVAPTVGTGTWRIVAGQNGAIGDPSSPTSVFSGQFGNTYILQWSTQNTALCPANSDEVAISFDVTDAKSYAGEDQVVFGDLTYLEAIPLSQNNPGTWKILGDSDGASLLAPSNPLSGLVGKENTRYLLQWEEILEGCNPTADTVEIFFREIPIAKAGPNQELLAKEETQLDANIPANDLTGTWNILEGIGGKIQEPTNPKSPFSGITGESYLLEWVLSYQEMALSRDSTQISFQPEQQAAECIPISFFSCPSSALPETKIPASQTRIIVPLPKNGLIDLNKGKRSLSLTFDRSSRFLQVTDSTGILQGSLATDNSDLFAFEAIVEFTRPNQRDHLSLKSPNEELENSSQSSGWKPTRGFLVGTGTIQGMIELIPAHQWDERSSNHHKVQLIGSLTAQNQTFNIQEQGEFTLRLPDCENICSTGMLFPLVHSLIAQGSFREVYLQWEQTTLGNAGYVEIQKSRDGINFFPLTTLKGNDWSLYPKTSSFVDRFISKDSVYSYRINQFIPSQGSKTGPIQVVSTFEADFTHIRMYPNPILGNKIHIFRQKNYMQSANYTLYSLHGQKILEGNLGKRPIETLSLEGISPGIYTMHIKGVGVEERVEKILKK